MLAAGQRLRRRDEFAAVIRGGRRAGRGSLVVHLVERATTGTVGGPARDALSRGGRGASAARSANPSASARAGFIVPRAVGTAVVRNRVRRRLRHAIRERLGTLPPDVDVVVRVLPAAASRSYAQLAADLDDALRAARSRPHRGAPARRADR